MDAVRPNHGRADMAAAYRLWSGAALQLEPEAIATQDLAPLGVIDVGHDLPDDGAPELDQGARALGLDADPRVLDEMLSVTGPEIERLRRRIARQDAAIEALRRKYGVNAERPRFFF